jgi:exonuclease III
MDMEPINDRLRYITLDCVMPINIINTYMPASIENIENTEMAYENLQKVFDKFKSRGHTYIGDFYARSMYP